MALVGKLISELGSARSLWALVSVINSPVLIGECVHGRIDGQNADKLKHVCHFEPIAAVIIHLQTVIEK